MSTAVYGGRLTLRPDLPFDGVKVFSATLFAERGRLGERVTAWMAEHSRFTVTQFVVTQSSDSEFHCLAITVFYREAGGGDEG
jgi:phage terminase large subunit GpA-like protein